MAANPYWQDLLMLDKQLSDEERMLRDTANQFCQETLKPGILSICCR